MKTYEEILALKDPLVDDYRERHEAHKKLRKFWHGRYWDEMERDDGGVSSIFRDLTGRSADVGPDIKLVYNLLKDVCVKFQTFLSPLPMIRCYVDPPSSPKRRNQATLKERYLYGLWGANRMNKVLSDNGWYLPLMGDCFLGIYPDLNTNLCRTVMRSPEYAYPIPSFDHDGLDAIVFCWRARESAVKRMFPNYVPQGENRKAKVSTFFGSRPGNQVGSDPEVEIMEYSDKDCFARYAGTQLLNGVDHHFGFNLYEHMKFINVPGEVWGHGAVEQAVNLVEMGNAYLSLMMQSAIENVFPPLVLEDPQKMPEQIERGAGSVLPVNAGGKAYFLTPPGGSLLANAQWSNEVERMVKQDTSMPDVNFGQFQASVVTGKAINELQGAGTGSLVEMVQGVSIGAALVAWNEKAIHIGRTMFKDEKMYLYGAETPSVAQINPRHFAFSIEGKKLVGSARNEVVFMPYLDMHSKVVMGLQLAGAGLVSRQWQREQVGIPDSEAMDEEILSEAIQDAVLGNLVATIQDPSAAAEAEEAGHSYIMGSVPGDGSAPPPILGLPSPANIPQAGPAMAPGAPLPTAPSGPQAQAPPGMEGAPPGMPPGMAPPGPQGMAATGVTLDVALSAMQQLPFTGRVFLVGEIVATGSTDDTVEVALTAPEDRQLLTQLPFPATGRVIDGEPSEPWIDVKSGISGGNEIPSEEEQPTVEVG